ncbi:MAG: primosomal protein N' [Candidatus Eremiobacteraeota bacterium]|nr:primosomal protein N' [Candidatus Eremiobacteraeota bacterium]
MRVPLGKREAFAFITRDPHEPADDRPLRAVIEKAAAPPAFNATGLALAKFVSEYYLCTLGEALSAAVLSSAVPRAVDELVRQTGVPAHGKYLSVPPRLVNLIWHDFPERFSLVALLRHPEARRCGDRRSLLAYVRALVQGGALARKRAFIEPRMHQYTVKMLYPADAEIRGHRATELTALVRERGSISRADALLAGYSRALIARAVKAGALREVDQAPARNVSTSAPSIVDLTPTADQAAALKEIRARLSDSRYAQILLQGVAGSGKTLVYIKAIEDVLARGGRAIVLVPEISLTPQTARRFQDAFGQRVAVLHSALSERERYDAWQASAHGDVDIIVGARSAIFAPLPDVRLVVVDEAHESAYKQESVPRYDAVTVARRRMQLENGVLLLGSATPSVESYAAANDGRLAHLMLRTRPSAQPLPAVRIVDMAAEFESGNRTVFSSALIGALDERLQRGEKSVLLINRRGSARFLLCRTCGYVPKCTRCSVAFTVHRSEGLLRCHYCDAQEPLFDVCPSCGASSTRELGIGTQRVVSEVGRLFRAARIIRMDSDTTTHIGDHARLLDEFERGGDVLVGTQMVAKGLDFPQVTLAAVVVAEFGLFGSDFRGAEQTFALVAQLCGRSGRAQPGEAIVQTYVPEHPAIRLAAAHDYDSFARGELEERRLSQWPPYVRLIYLGVIGRDRENVVEQATKYASVLRGSSSAEVLGPAPFPIARLNEEWRYRIALKTHDAPALRRFLRDTLLPQARRERNTRLAIDVDP